MTTEDSAELVKLILLLAGRGNIAPHKNARTLIKSIVKDVLDNVRKGNDVTRLIADCNHTFTFGKVESSKVFRRPKADA